MPISGASVWPVLNKLVGSSNLLRVPVINHQNLWVFGPEGYGLWVIAVVWVMEHFSLRTNSVDSKTYGI